GCRRMSSSTNNSSSLPECLDAPPCCLRDKSAFLIAPLSRSLALVGRNDSTPWAVTPSQVDALLAAWSLDWIAHGGCRCRCASRSTRRPEIQCNLSLRARLFRNHDWSWAGRPEGEIIGEGNAVHLVIRSHRRRHRFDEGVRVDARTIVHVGG